MSEKEDFSGRKRLASNVLWSWAGHLVFVISGFVMPRLIDNNLGQELLGIWDFCWSLVSYLNLASFGIGSSVNRYVARYRAAGEIDHLCRAISSVVAIQIAIGAIVVLATTGLVFLLPAVFSARLGENLQTTQIAVAFLGLSLAVYMGLDAFRGVISGCHRWDLHNGVQAGSYGITMIGMIIALASGGGIVSLAVVYFFGAVMGEVARVILAFRVCPELKLRRSYASWEYGKPMVIFGGKVLLLGVPPLLMLQTINVQVAAVMGPASLAILSRPLGLVRHSEQLLAKFSYMLAPMAGSIHGDDQISKHRDLLLYGTRWSVALAMPAALGLAVLGDPLIGLWMGPAYIHPGLMPLLALGLFLSTAHSSSVQILIGMNLHGRVGICIAAWVVFVLTAGVMVLNHVGWTLNGAGALIVVSMAPSYGIMLPAYLCKHLGVSLVVYLRQVLLLPLFCGMILAAVLLGTRFMLGQHPLAIVLIGAPMGGAVILCLYWFLLLAEDQRKQLLLAARGMLTKVFS